MKLIYSCAFLLFCFCSAFAQAPDFSWIKTNYEAIFPLTTAVDSFGNLYVAGYFTQGSATFGNTTLNGVKSFDYPFIVKYNFKGDVIWAFGNSYSNCDGRFNKIAIDVDGNIYVTGYYSSSSIKFGNYNLTLNGNSDSFIIKYDAGGNVMWANNIGGSDFDYVKGIVVDDGNVYCVGQFKSNNLFVDAIINGNSINDTTLINKNNLKNDAFIVKYNGAGSLKWALSFGDSISEDCATEVSVALDHSIYISGYWNAAASASIHIGPSTITEKSGNDALIVKINNNGSIGWAKSFGGYSSDQGSFIEVKNSIYMAGLFYSSSQFDTISLTSTGYSDIFLVKMDTAGNINWAKQMGCAQYDDIYGMALDADENVYLSGRYGQNSNFIADSITLTNNGKYDAYYVKYNSSGKVSWAFGYGGTQNDYGYDITTDNQSNLFISGTFTSSSIVLSNDTLANAGNAGDYNSIIATLVDYSDTVSIIDTTHIYFPRNGGLYGGGSADLAYSKTGTRLFSGMQTPASLFISDDGASTWYQAFNKDSLEYSVNGIVRGWSGKATKILTNQNNWVAVQTNHPKGRYSSAVISYSNGDTNTWKTVADPEQLTQWGFASHHVSAIALSDYYLMVALGPFIVKKGSGAINPSTDITNSISSVGGLPLKSTINSIAIANNANAYPYYIAIDTNGFTNGYNRLLYKFDGSIYSKINLPSNLNSIWAVFTHPKQISGDTIFITAKDTNTNAFKIYKSYDAGANWVDISYSSATDFLSDVDYSANWNLSASNNIILIIPGNAISKDLGTSWEVLSDTAHTANTINPDNINTIVGSDKTIEISTTGTTGTFSRTQSDGLEALNVNKIARTASEKLFYIATKTGLGYTKEYLNDTLTEAEKWQSPHGAFPLISDSINFGAVAIDPTDSLHVIAGSPYGFYTTTTGEMGFSKITPTNFTTNNPQVKDILFVNHNTAIAVTGGDSAIDAGKGNIWKTIDGGGNWTNVSPSGFKSGNTIATGNIGADTVIYVGTGLLNIDTGFIWKSNDIGQTWAQIKNGPTSLAGTSVLGLPINDIAVDPRGRDTLYIAAGYEEEYAFVLSFDGAETYTYLNSYAQKPYTSIGIHKQFPDTVYLATGREIYLYDLAHNNFRFMYRSLPDVQIPDIMTGSIIVATSTGLYTYRPTWEDDLDSGIIVNNSLKMIDNNELNVFPNPFTDEATIKLYVKENSKVSIEMYDLMGQKIESIYIGSCKQGYTNYEISPNNLSSGSYLLYANVNGLPYRKLLYHVR